MSHSKTYQEAITEDMKCMGERSDTVFLGQGLINAGRIYHTLDGVPKSKCIEMPIAENLIMGAAIGMALKGYKPIVVFQRMDFMLIAADAIINHLALIPGMSGGKISLPIIIRACVGSKDMKFDVGPQHKHDFRHVFMRYISTIDYAPGIYRTVYENKSPCIVVEEKDKYDKTV